jgi:hypothetical protein
MTLPLVIVADLIARIQDVPDAETWMIELGLRMRYNDL